MKKIIFLLFFALSINSIYAGTTTETRTMTWPMNGTGVSGSELTNSAGNRLVLSKNSWQGNSTASKPYTQILNENYGLVGTEITFPDIVGKVTSVELTNVLFAQGGMCLKAGINSSTLLSSTVFASYDDEEFKTYTSAFTFSGALDVTDAMPLKLMFMTANTAPEGQLCKFIQGSITVTYEVEVEVPDPEDPGHNFSFNVSGNTLTATCNQQSQYHNCGLTDGKAALTLSVEDCTGNGDFTYNPASINLAEFNQQTGLQATKGDITYTNKTTSQTTTVASQVSDVGSYTASVTVTIGGNNYTLTKGFNILAGYRVNNSYQQFSVSKTSALVGDEITITYTQLMDESLDGLTLMGATSGNKITYTDHHDDTYTFTMPAEDVTINATITYPLNENNITQSGDIYTIKTAEGWNYFCRRMEVDGDLNGFSGKTVVLAGNITVTTSMAGSGKYPFKGTFDGDGHTLTFNHTASAPCSAPFQNTNGATIRNLHATGLIEGGNWNYMGGLVGSANGKLTIENCRVSTQISSTISGIANNGGFVGLLSSYYDQCHITGCVFDGLICNSNTWNQTYGCGGFVGGFSQYGYAILEDCLFLHGQYDNNGNKCELYWGYDNAMNSTFLHRSNDGAGTLTNCFYVGTRGLKQGSPAVESATAPTNFAHLGTPTDHCFMKTYGRLMVFNNKYYTPPYGDLVETYDFSGVKSYNIEYDDKPLGIPDITTQLWVPLLRYKRTFTNGKPVTVMLPFNFTKSAFKKGGSSDGLTGHFYEFKGIRLDVNVSNKWVAVMKEVGSDDANEVTTMKANTPYLYIPDEEPQYWYIDNGGDGVNIFTEGYDGGNKVTPYDGSNESYSWNKWNFKGTYQPRYWSDSENSEEIGKVYGFAGATKEVDEKHVVAGDFVRAKSGAKIRPTSCYLMWAGSEPSNARALTRSAAAEDVELPQSITVKLVGANGETSAIGTLDTKTGEMTFDSEAWYTLDGVRLSGKPSSKGIYINNGKKVVIK